MKKRLIQLSLLGAIMSLTACTNMNNFFGSEPSKSQKPVNPLDQPLASTNVQGGPVGGSLASGMDSIDKSKASHALDKAPGTETKWTNSISGATYLIKPVQKLSVSGYQFCRSYYFSLTKQGNTQQMTGRACIGNDGNWQDIGG